MKYLIILMLLMSGCGNTPDVQTETGEITFDGGII